MKEAKSEAKQDTGPETPGEDMFDQIIAAHVAKVAEVTAKIPVGKTVGPEDITALRDELKAFIISTMSALGSTMISTVSATAAPMMAAAVAKAASQDSEQDSAEEDAEAARIQAIVDDGVSRMQALTARVTDALSEDRKAVLAALTALSKPRKRTGTVTLPSGKVEMTITDTVQ